MSVTGGPVAWEWQLMQTIALSIGRRAPLELCNLIKGTPIIHHPAS